MSRYNVPSRVDDYQPGSKGRVLKNLLGFTSPTQIKRAESQAYKLMVRESLAQLSDDQVLTSSYINHLHEQWLRGIYPFAGKYRTVNVSKGGFAFCVAEYIPEQMRMLNKILRSNMPCCGMSKQEVVRALASVHGEFILIHPYREGNGRLGRWVASIMALQAGYPILDITEEVKMSGRKAYFAAIRRFASDSLPLENWFSEVLERQTLPPRDLWA